MRKYFYMWSVLLLLSVLPGCGKKTDTAPETEAAAEEETPPSPGEENWGTAPDFNASLITNSQIRCLSATVGETADSVLLTWHSPDESAGQVLWTAADDEDFTDASSFDAEVSPSEITSGYYVNRAKVTGLDPETDYLYQVGCGENVSPVYRFTTPPSSDSFRFAAAGDAQLGKPVEELEKQKRTWHNVLNKVKYHFPDTSFLVSLGDLVNDYNDKEEYDAYSNQPALYSLSLVPVKGNHDVGGPQFSEHFTLPNQSQLGTCDDEGDGDYWFRRGCALFLVLDMMDAAKWGEHKDFIADAVDTNPDAVWRIVFMHYSPYNTYEDYIENSENLRPYVLEFADAYDIDLMMTGHDHSYSRTYFINADGSYEEYESPAENPQGTMFVTLTSSSGSLYHRPSTVDEVAVSNHDEAPQITDVQVTPESLTITTYDAETWATVDEFEIRKNTQSTE